MRIVNIGSSWGQPGVVLGSSYWIQPDGVNLGSTWGQPGVNLGSTWGQPGFNLGSTWGEPLPLHHGAASARRVPRRAHAVPPVQRAAPAREALQLHPAPLRASQTSPGGPRWSGTGARAKGWCLLTHAVGSISRSLLSYSPTCVGPEVTNLERPHFDAPPPQPMFTADRGYSPDPHCPHPGSPGSTSLRFN